MKIELGVLFFGGLNLVPFFGGLVVMSFVEKLRLDSKSLHAVWPRHLWIPEFASRNHVQKTRAFLDLWCIWMYMDICTYTYTWHNTMYINIFIYVYTHTVCIYTYTVHTYIYILLYDVFILVCMCIYNAIYVVEENTAQAPFSESTLRRHEESWEQSTEIYGEWK